LEFGGGRFIYKLDGTGASAGPSGGGSSMSSSGKYVIGVRGGVGERWVESEECVSGGVIGVVIVLKPLAVGSRCRVRWLMVLINLTVGSLELSSRLVGVSGNLTTNSTG